VQQPFVCAAALCLVPQPFVWCRSPLSGAAALCLVPQPFVWCRSPLSVQPFVFKFKCSLQSFVSAVICFQVQMLSAVICLCRHLFSNSNVHGGALRTPSSMI
jgi:hypothetical protein